MSDVRHKNKKMNIGMGAAILLWVLMLWPLIVVVGYTLLFRPQVNNVPALAFVSIVVGYASSFGVMSLTYERFITNYELLVVLLPWFVPIITTHILARVASRKAKGSLNA